MVERKRPHFVGVWLSEIGKQGVEDLAAREELSRSDLVRLALAYAVRKMPKGWRP